MGSAFGMEHWLALVPHDDPIRHELVLFAFGDRDERLLHWPTSLCAEESPHRADECGHFQHRLGRAQMSRESLSGIERPPS